MLQIEQEDLLVNFLAYIYKRVPWGKMRTSKNPYDIFNHRVRSAARRGTLYQFSSKLCNYFGLQTLPFQAQKLLDEMRPFETEVLNTLSTEHIPFCVRGIMKAKQMREEEKLKKQKLKKEKEQNND